MVVEVRIPDFAELTRDLGLTDFEFKAAFDRYLGQLGPAAPVKSLEEFVGRGEYHPSLTTLPDLARAGDRSNDWEYWGRLARREALGRAVLELLNKQRLDALLYPHQKRLVVPIGEEQVDRNGVLANATGFTAVAFPGGFSEPTADAQIGVPVGIELLGPEWSEPKLLAYAFAYEQAARVRRPPPTTPFATAG